MQRTCQLSITFLVKSNTQFEQIGCALEWKIKAALKIVHLENKKPLSIRGLRMNYKIESFKEAESPYGSPLLFH